jgi:hypothetical protein
MNEEQKRKILSVIRRVGSDFILGSTNKENPYRNNAAFFSMMRQSGTRTQLSKDSKACHYYVYEKKTKTPSWEAIVTPNRDKDPRCHLPAKECHNFQKLDEELRQFLLLESRDQHARTANCHGLSSALLKKLWELANVYSFIQRLEIVELASSLHFVCVINRKQESDLQDPKSWHGQVVDIWGFEKEEGHWGNYEDCIFDSSFLQSRMKTLVDNKKLDFHIHAQTTNPINFLMSNLSVCFEIHPQKTSIPSPFHMEYFPAEVNVNEVILSRLKTQKYFKAKLSPELLKTAPGVQKRGANLRNCVLS